VTAPSANAAPTGTLSGVYWSGVVAQALALVDCSSAANGRRLGSAHGSSAMLACDAVARLRTAPVPAPRWLDFALARPV
jgi:hypothetical protein